MPGLGSCTTRPLWSLPGKIGGVAGAAVSGCDKLRFGRIPAFATVAQLAEHRFCKAKVAGSIPAGGLEDGLVFEVSLATSACLGGAGVRCGNSTQSMGRTMPPAGFEPATCALGKHCSIQLSYEGGGTRRRTERDPVLRPSVRCAARRKNTAARRTGPMRVLILRHIGQFSCGPRPNHDQLGKP